MILEYKNNAMLRTKKEKMAFNKYIMQNKYNQ